METSPIELIPHLHTKLPKSYKIGEVSLAQSWAVRITSLALIGRSGHDGEDKIRFLSCHGFLPRLAANGVWNLHHNYCSGSQIPEFGALLVWERYALHTSYVFRWAFILLGWADSSLCVVPVAGHAANGCAFSAVFLAQSVSFFVLLRSGVN